MRGGTAPGTMLATAILFLWLAGLCYFIAFESGSSFALAIGENSSGTLEGPTNITTLTQRLADNAQALQNPPSTAGQ